MPTASRQTAGRMLPDDGTKPTDTDISLLLTCQPYGLTDWFSSSSTKFHIVSLYIYTYSPLVCALIAHANISRPLSPIDRHRPTACLLRPHCRIRPRGYWRGLSRFTCAAPLSCRLGPVPATRALRLARNREPVTATNPNCARTLERRHCLHERCCLETMAEVEVAPTFGAELKVRTTGRKSRLPRHSRRCADCLCTTNRMASNPPTPG